MDNNIENGENKMLSTIQNLQHTLSGLRTGRASTALLDPIKVDVYGSLMSISQVATLSTPDARTINVQVWDKSLVKEVEKAILNSSLGLNPMVDNQYIRVPIPDLTEDRRKELTKKASEYGENAKVAIRNIRRDLMDEIKKMEKEKQISEDDMKRQSDEVQKLTDNYIKKIDEHVKNKNLEIMEI